MISKKRNVKSNVKETKYEHNRKKISADLAQVIGFGIDRIQNKLYEKCC